MEGGGEGGGGAIDDTHTSKDILLKNDQNSTYINLFTVICGLVSHDKYSDIYFDKKQH